MTAVDKAKLKAAIDQQIGIDKTGGIGYIAGLPSFTNMPDFTAPTVPSINKVGDTTTSVTGKAEANSVVDLYINGKYQESTTADKNGNYKFSIINQKIGTELSVTATDEAGNESDSRATVVTDKTAPSIPSANKVTAKSKSVTGTAEKFATVKVYNGNKLVGHAVANSKGKYTVKIKAQKEGTKLTISATDKAGNQSKSRTAIVAAK